MAKFRITAPDGKSYDVEGPEGSTADQALAQVQAQYGETSAPISGGPTSVNAGLANLTATSLGLPMETLKNVANLGIAGYGTAKGMMGGLPPDLIARLPGDVASTQALFSRAAQQSGIRGLSPENPNPENPLVYNLVSKGAGIPGFTLPAIGSEIGGRVAGTPGAIIGAMGPSAAISGYNAARAPTLARQQFQNQVRDVTLKDAQEAGYVVPPSHVNPSFLGARLEGLAGKTAIQQESQIKNQEVTNRLAKQDVGISEETPLTVDSLTAKRQEFSTPYKEISGISPMASNVLQKLRDARSEANAQWIYYDRSAVPEAQRLAKQYDGQAKMLEGVLEGIVRRSGKPELVQEMREARANIAKTYDVERALNVGNGNVSAPIIGRALDRGRPLTGGLATIARFNQAFGPFTRESTMTPTPGVSRSEALGATALGLGGHMAFGPYGAAAALLPFLSSPTRAMMLSRPYQNAFATPSYSAAMRPDAAQSLLPILLGQP